MESNFLKSKYRLLVLFDQSKIAHTALRNAIDLAKVIDAGIDVFYVKSPTQVVRFENQIAAMRSIKEERSRAKKGMLKLANTISHEENIPVIFNFTFGNVINEIQKHIDKTQPDIVIIGKRKSKVVNFLGDGVTSHLLKNHVGGILISGKEDTLISGDNISIGFLDDTIKKNKCGIAEDLKKSTDKPFKLFKINNRAIDSKKETSFSKQKEEVLSSNTTTFEFDKGTDISDSISSYIDKSKVGLLCVEKSKLLNSGNLEKAIRRQIQKTINKTNIPVLILEK